ncbi:LPXTG cell wall anchor domain-containing protein [Streptomyces sp. TRM70350]|uniref:LPXTG cell wall anchor domain-containing protein n=1 Tax=Streptomyces sp. TRM70350 TaxID=2856165 RepID=UPI001C451D26|nr:LPXTG cell wall anchor domain-containing protein [Streptomyces sp. TRM70350]MBV7699995.1 LPXTG cell wall anchor domain-containing protein [Streptomyces sp. TRM70350]
MSSARRPLLTATAAGTLLGALWFVPSANATADGTAREQSTATPTTQARAMPTDTADSAADGTRLADTGSFDSTPYVLGGALCLTLGAGFVAYSVRRERLGL